MMISDVSVAPIIFCCCVLIQALLVKQEPLQLVLGLMFKTSDHRHQDDSVDLPVIRFEDLRRRRHGSVDSLCSVCMSEFEGKDLVSRLGQCGRRRHGSVDSLCSVCMSEFEGKDLVSRLGPCGHVFHTSCIERQLRWHHFTCPFCRSSLFGINAVSEGKQW